MFVQRCRRWTNIKPALVQRILLCWETTDILDRLIVAKLCFFKKLIDSDITKQCKCPLSFQYLFLETT